MVLVFTPCSAIFHLDVYKRQDVCCSGVDYVDIERHLRYKEANLDVRLDGNYLVLKTDAFIRCVEIKGQSGEDEFGWLFSDNYFDLMPGEEKRVKILGNKDSGQLRIKGHYLPVSYTHLDVYKRQGYR